MFRNSRFTSLSNPKMAGWRPHACQATSRDRHGNALHCSLLMEKASNLPKPGRPEATGSLIAPSSGHSPLGVHVHVRAPDDGWPESSNHVSPRRGHLCQSLSEAHGARSPVAQRVPSHVQGRLKPCKYCGATGQPDMNDDSHSARLALALHSLPRATARKSTRPGMAQPLVLARVGVRLCMLGATATARRRVGNSHVGACYLELARRRLAYTHSQHFVRKR